MAIESGHVIKPSNGWFQRVDTDSGEAVEPKVRNKDTYTKDFWLPILKDQTFIDWIEKRYTISSSDGIMKEEITEEDIADVYEAIEV